MFMAAAKMFQRLVDGQWVASTEGEVTALTAAFDQEFPGGPDLQSTADLSKLARFYGEHNYGLLQLMYLDAVMQKADGNQLAAVEQFADTLQAYGFHEAALISYRFAPTLVDQSGPRAARSIARLVQAQGRSLDALGRRGEADAAFILARRFSELAGRPSATGQFRAARRRIPG
jgi:hypothetical protein